MVENHDTLAWLVSTRQQQSIGTALAWTDEHLSEEGRARAFDEWLHHSDRMSCGFRTPDGVEAARAIKLEPDESAWDLELLLSVKGLPWDRERRDPTIWVSLLSTRLPPGVPLPTELRAGGDGGQGGVPGPRRVCIRKKVEILKFGQTHHHREQSINLSQQRMQETRGKCNA